jgi:1,5-anhydro-D-fructose reductase (1,5-anhydro-D-mannitol-forming)
VTDGLRWGAIGASWIAEDWMLPAIRETGAEVVAVASHDAARATSYAARNGIAAAYGDVEALLADPNVDAVYISSTNQWHQPQAVAAARAGKHVLVEKPMATTVAEAQAMIEACTVAGVVLAVDHHMRHAPTLRAMKRVLDAGAVGRPLAVRIAHAILLPEFLRTWRTSAPDAGGGPILDLTTHDTDNLRFLLDDEVADVVATTAGQRFSANGVEDAVMTVMRFRSGVIASTYDAYTVGGSQTMVEIHGTEGSLIGTEVLRQGPVGDVVLRRGDEVERVDVGERSDLYAATVRAFTRAVRGAGRPTVTGEDGLRAVEVALAVIEAARSGRRVPIGAPTAA